MCRQYFTLYEWCQCEEDAGNSVCAAHRRNGCPGVSVETVHMHCFCNSHATHGFKSEKETRKKENKMRRRSEDSFALAFVGIGDLGLDLGEKWNSAGFTIFHHVDDLNDVHKI
ncbi:hypothetical protein PDIG_23280 [Penicillium digitatum PHI26]|uniref:Uncharacterized protein n=2 Tax=Penicillium digitatum TaxID=36651 RepID=K9GMP1_PEND2|nr:hypothetical protein PDIP_15680 [Penicillium digitatum Pd1]EKV15973.1 hypothetical protein PDIG_23280 [Penicillium digitatum PHI26]EKV20484.1 hypothetical protein PDIP_15680 [Penicillium digitatum Pd1]